MNTSPTTDTSMGSKKSLRRAGMIIGLVCVVIAVLASAAFVGEQLLQAGDKPQSAQRPPQKLVTPAAGLPTGQPDTQGDVQNVGDSSFLVCTFNPDHSLSVNPDGSVNQDGGCGAEIEVVIGRDTIFYHDITSRQYIGTPVPNQDLVLQEKVEAGSVHDIAVNTSMMVWGTRSGNRIQAGIVVYWVRPTRPTGG